MAPTILDDIEKQGWSVQPAFLPAEEALALASESQSAWTQGNFRRAGVGRGSGLAIREDIRRDHVLWLQPSSTTPLQQAYLDRLESLRNDLNRHFFLGLFDFEGHFAVYPEGAFYKAHLDRHQNTRDRLITTILYLNRDWQPDHGGELKLWTTPGSQDGPFITVEPRLGTLVTFLAGDFWHEVLPAKHTRMSITGWFRCRS